MLFDLRSRGRRRAIRVVYGFLAVLIGGGLVLFGVGGGAGSTGLLSQLAQQGNGSATGIKLDEKATAKAQRAAKAAPNSASAWDNYGLQVFKLADTNYVTSTTQPGFTAPGVKELRVLGRVWNHYLSLSPAKPDATLAADVAFAYGANGTDQFKIAETGDEVVAQDGPTWHNYYQLAFDAFLAKDDTAGELAESRALALAPASEKKQISSTLAVYAPSTGASGTTGATGSTAGTGASGASG